RSNARRPPLRHPRRRGPLAGGGTLRGSALVRTNLRARRSPGNRLIQLKDVANSIYVERRLSQRRGRGDRARGGDAPPCYALDFSNVHDAVSVLRDVLTG